MESLYSTVSLIAMVRALVEPTSFFLDRYYTTLVEEDKEEIAFDVEDGKRRISPFVSPTMGGKVVRSKGFKTDKFKPAYIKDKRPLDPDRPVKRAIGEAVGGVLSAGERLALITMQEMEDQVEMLRRREELMAIEAMQTGKTIVDGEGYDAVEVDYGRDPSLTIALAGSGRWGEVGVSPGDDVEAWGNQVLRKSGAAPQDVIFRDAAWKYFKEDPKVKDTIEVRRGGGSQIELGPQLKRGAQFKGTWGNFNLFVHEDHYVDDADVEHPYMADNSVIVAGDQVEGTRYYGAIKDTKAGPNGYQAMRFFPKSWEEEDPSIRFLLLQSAPLMVPKRINACLGATVR